MKEEEKFSFGRHATMDQGCHFHREKEILEEEGEEKEEGEEEGERKKKGK